MFGFCWFPITPMSQNRIWSQNSTLELQSLTKDSLNKESGIASLAVINNSHPVKLSVQHILFGNRSCLCSFKHSTPQNSIEHQGKSHT